MNKVTTNKNRRYLKTVSGVYEIRVAQYVYIGSSDSVWARWLNHASRLRRGVHDCIDLQLVWDKYYLSEDDLELSLLEETSDLCAREQYHLEHVASDDILLNTRNAVYPYVPAHIPQVGELANCAKMTWNKVNKLRNEYDPLKHTHRSLASEYGISHTALQNILSFKTWKINE